MGKWKYSKKTCRYSVGCKSLCKCSKCPNFKPKLEQETKWGKKEWREHWGLTGVKK